MVNTCTSIEVTNDVTYPKIQSHPNTMARYFPYTNTFQAIMGIKGQLNVTWSTEFNDE